MSGILVTYGGAMVQSTGCVILQALNRRPSWSDQGIVLLQALLASCSISGTSTGPFTVSSLSACTTASATASTFRGLTPAAPIKLPNIPPVAPLKTAPTSHHGGHGHRDRPRAIVQEGRADKYASHAWKLPRNRTLGLPFRRDISRREDGGSRCSGDVNEGRRVFPGRPPWPA